jgi:polyisoprenoid-binding protein YceI
MKFIVRLPAVLLASLISYSAMAQQAVVDIHLKPAGSFKVKSTDVKGVVEQKGDHIEAHNIVVGLAKVETGIAMRDEHTRKHLEVDKFPNATLVSATGKGGKGEGTIKIKGIEHKISGTYKIDGGNCIATFPLQLSDYKIEGIKYMGVGVADDVSITVTVPVK